MADVPQLRLGVRAVAEAVARGLTTPTEVTVAVLDRIRRLEPAVRAWSVVDADGALRQARVLTEEASAGRLRGPLHGVPVGVKDEFDVAGMATAMRGAAAPPAGRDAACVQRLREAGAIVVGKTAMPVDGRPAPTRNPWNTAHTPGGTSSGAAAAVAARMVPLAVAEQTAGSTLRPAAYCGVVGLKPSYGRISRFGCAPFTWSRDHVGLIGLGVDDVAIALSVLAGPDPRDPTTLPDAGPPFRPGRPARSRPPRIGVVERFLSDQIEPDMAAAVAACAVRLRDAGAVVPVVRLPEEFALAWPAADILDAERAALAARSGRASRQHIAGLVPAAYYIQAQRVRTWLAAQLHALMRGYDALLMPAALGGAPAGLASTGSSAPLVPWSLLGVPAVTLNGGVGARALPLGVQFVGGAHDDLRLLEVASWCEAVLGPLGEPPLATGLPTAQPPRPDPATC